MAATCAGFGWNVSSAAPSHILYAHAKGGLQYRAAATDSLGRNIYATALCETQPQFFPRFLESADSWWVITAKV